MDEKPYIETTITKVVRSWNPKYPSEELCTCGHVYYRHFDSYEDMEPVGCKYCPCWDFAERP